MPRLSILDCGIGNLRSVEKALERSGAEVTVTSDVEMARGSDGLVLPGVGAFPAAMEKIRAGGVDRFLEQESAGGTPLLGICLGMQLLFEYSAEGGGSEGICLLEGTVETLEAPGLKVPHIGWERVTWAKSDALAGKPGEGEDFYFVHGFSARPSDPGDVLGASIYGEEFCAAVARDNIWGVQFHPEKSSDAGLALLGRFVKVCSR